MNAALLTPFSESVAEFSGGRLTVSHFPGGALNSSPARQYAILLDGVADIAFALPGYTADLFPKTNVISFPGVCRTAVECTEALQRARPVLEREYQAKVLAIWATDAPVLLTRDRPVRVLEDMRGLKIRVSSRGDIAFIEALGASAVMQPATVLQQNLANGVLDGIAIAPSGISGLRLHEPANFLTTWLPLSGTPFALLMNRDVYASLSDREKGWLDAAAGPALSMRGAIGYAQESLRSLEASEEAGIEIIHLAEQQQLRFEQAIASAVEARLSRSAGDMTVREVVDLFGRR